MKFEGKKYKREKDEVVNTWLTGRNKQPPADPATDDLRFDAACSEAKSLAVIAGRDIAVFRSELGYYFVREAEWCEPSIDKLYIAKAKEEK